MNTEKMYNMLRAGKLKGHTRITLEDVRTGHRTIVEDDNMQTNALPKIFESNYNGCEDCYNLMPLKTLIGGVYLFWSPLTESADNMFPPAQDVNKLSFYAGQTAHSTANPYRGNPNGTATVIDAANGQIKFVWDWALEGSGEVSAAALTHQDFGDAGLTPDGSMALAKAFGLTVSGINSFSEQAFGQTYDEAMSKRFPVSIKDTGVGVTVWISGTTFTEKLVRHPWIKPSLIEGPALNDGDNFTILSTRTATLSRTFTSGYTMIAQDDANYYVMERDSQSATTLHVDIVSKTDMSVTTPTISIAENLARTATTRTQINNGIVSGGNIYWISGADAKTFVRIPITNPADAVVLTSTLTENISILSTPVSLSAGLVLGRNYIINGNNVYPVAKRTTLDWYTDSNDVIANYKNSPMKYTAPLPNQSYSTRYIVAGGLLVPYLATVNNLQSTVQKTTNQTMRCEYTVTFTEAI